MTNYSNMSDLLNKQDAEVYLEVLEGSKDKKSVRLVNKMTKAIFLAYAPVMNSKDSTVFTFYQLRCKSEGEKEYKDYGSTSHIVPTLSKLDGEKSLDFEVDNLPKITGDCNIQVLYYEDEKIARLINTENATMSNSEADLVEQAKKYVRLEFNVGK